MSAKAKLVALCDVGDPVQDENVQFEKLSLNLEIIAIHLFVCYQLKLFHKYTDTKTLALAKVYCRHLSKYALKFSTMSLLQRNFNLCSILLLYTET